VFDHLYCFINSLGQLKKEIRVKISDILFGGVTNFLEINATYVPMVQLKMWCYLIYFFVTKAMAGKEKEKDDISKCLKVIQTVLKQQEISEDLLPLISGIAFAALPNKQKSSEIYAIWNVVLARMPQEEISNW
jgi:hypothetical protein